MRNCPFRSSFYISWSHPPWPCNFPLLLFFRSNNQPCFSSFFFGDAEIDSSLKGEEGGKRRFGPLLQHLLVERSINTGYFGMEKSSCLCLVNNKFPVKVPGNLRLFFQFPLIAPPAISQICWKVNSTVEIKFPYYDFFPALCLFFYFLLFFKVGVSHPPISQLLRKFWGHVQKSSFFLFFSQFF